MDKGTVDMLAFCSIGMVLFFIAVVIAVICRWIDKLNK